MQADDVSKALRTIAASADTKEFRTWRARFVEENAGKFAYEEENKLEYTQIFNEFEKGIESHLSKAFQDVDLAALEEALEGGCAVPEEAQEAVKMLQEMGDFVAFKDMMLFEKERIDKAADGPPAAPSDAPAVAVPAMDGLLEASQRLARVTEGGAGGEWRSLLSSDWYKFEAMPAGDGRTEFVRMTFDIKLPFVECVDMQCSIDERRALWEPGVKSTELLRGDSVYDEDHITRNHLNMGFMFHLAGFPKTLTIRIKKRFDTKAGVLTVAVAPWDMDKDCVDAKSVMGLTVVTISPHSSDPKRSVLTQWQQDPVGKSTGRLATTFMSYVVPKMYSTRVGKYAANISGKGKVVDYLAEARKAGAAWASA
mmetsp:Transcript_6610/g.15938  ORF Transcript_6610/g.15938 Transcript_6610/m.15938 type:complete len:368 (-) Transcript_6610:202-1305(-)